MKRMPAQAGLTLVELMIALMLGMLTTLFGGALLLSASAGYLVQTDAARLDDAGRFALDTVERTLRQAARLNWDADGAQAGAARAASVAGLDARSLSRSTELIADPRAGVANGSDVLAVHFAGAGAGPDGDGSILNCAGFSVPAGDDDVRGWSIFYVALGADGETELRCKYHGASGWAADAIVRGVDSFQVLYGIDTDVPADGVVNRFVSADAINAMDAALSLSGADSAARERDRRRKTYWKRVGSIKVSMLLHGSGRRPGEAPTRRFELFGKAYADAYAGSDQGTRIDERDLAPQLSARSRQLFAATTTLRNPSL